jgi:nitrogen fixation/metabolism regulation signal transduction histidine kinase
VLTEVHRISEIVTEFTKFARLAPPRFARVDLLATARSVAALHDGQGITGAPRVEIEHEPLPEVLADRDQIVQVLTNLVQNGIDAARTFDPPPAFARVIVRLEPLVPKSVRITVTDNGPGVDSAVRDRLFEPYASTKPGGTGLGLAIAQRIVFEHGGELRLVERSEPGACFEVVLPVDGPPLPERATQPSDD